MPKYAHKIGRERHDVVDKETRQIAYHVSRVHAGKFRNDKARSEYAGPKEDTYKKYVHVINMWLDFCLVCWFSGRWAVLPLSEAMWVAVAAHFFHNGLPNGLQCSTLEQYLRMLAHVLIFMNDVPVPVLGSLHKQQFAIIQRVVTSFGIVYPAARTKRNTKKAWDASLVDKGMQLLLLWEHYGHCHMHTPAWPAYARLTLSLFCYLQGLLPSPTGLAPYLFHPQAGRTVLCPVGWTCCDLFWRLPTALGTRVPCCCASQDDAHEVQQGPTV